ncbi:type IV toxin-antitoxin system AbiEi family antitoxin domain-containing protein [Enterovibrio baiacu]|uniref:type IV toxin-antitoxin system AbiEi family antitoxin domain-containing protein n=1 Tax=Enterovibrio baiacu TaxID=2491023 RepID=UPI003D0C780E
MINSKIELRTALRNQIIEEVEKPALSMSELRGMIYDLYKAREYKGQIINKLSLSEPSLRVMGEVIESMEESGVISQYYEFPIFFVNSNKKPTAQQFICTINNLCYIGFISAMEWHGITDRIPNVIYTKSCSRKDYKSKQLDLVEKKYNDVESLNYLIQPYVSNIPGYDRKEFIVYESKNYNPVKELYGSGGVRVSSIGETFLDMLKNPDYCGGFDHVLDVYLEYSEEHLPVIVKYIEKNGSKIDKARAGYILEEECGLSHRTIEKWKLDVQRGGSRKLVATNEYNSIYSDTWCISINK